MRCETFDGRARCPQRAADWNVIILIHEDGAQGLARPTLVSPVWKRTLDCLSLASRLDMVWGTQYVIRHGVCSFSHHRCPECKSHNLGSCHPIQMDATHARPRDQTQYPLTPKVILTRLP